MKTLILSLIFLMSTGLVTWAGELDNESQVTNQKLQGTVIVRIDTRNESAAIIHSPAVFTNNKQAESFAVSSEFKVLDQVHVRTELDNDGGASSWYFYRRPFYYNNYNYYNNYFYWYGNYYHPCYSYSYGYYNYYYYTPYYWGW